MNRLTLAFFASSAFMASAIQAAQPPYANHFVGRESAHWRRNEPLPHNWRDRRPEVALPEGNAVLTYSTFLGGNANDHASAIVTNSSGDIYVAGNTLSPDFPVAPAAWDTRATGGQLGFVARFNADGSLAWCTYLGGGRTTSISAMAVDRYGNSYITGTTDSPSAFPTTEGAILESSFASNSSSLKAIFVTKLNSAGNALLYSTLLGSGSSTLFGTSSTDSAGGIAVDSSGHAFVTGIDNSPELTATPGAAIARSPMGSFIAKLNPAGTRYIYATALTSAYDAPSAVTLDGSGNAYVAGATTDRTTRSAGAVQPLNGTHSIYKTADGGSTWNITGTGLEHTSITTVAVDPSNGSSVYVGGSGGLFRSLDGGISWSQLAGTPVYAVAVDPAGSSHLLLLTAPGGYAISHDSGATWISGGIIHGNNLEFDPARPQNVYAYGTGVLDYSHDGGNTFLPALGPSLFTRPAIEPTGTLYSSSPAGVSSSVNAGVSWIQISGATYFRYGPLAIDPLGSGTLYTVSTLGFAKSIGGANWSFPGGSTVGSGTDLLFDPTDPKTLYILTSVGIYSTTDGGATINPAPAQPWNPQVKALAFDLQHPGTRYALTSDASDAFVTRIGADGATIGFSTYFGGSGLDTAASIALDPAGDIYITGTTGSPDLPSAMGRGGGNDAYLAKLSGDGTQLLWSRYFGGSLADGANSLAVDDSGNAVIGGFTNSVDLPNTADAIESTHPGTASIGFYARFDPDGNVRSASYIGGAEGDSVFAVAIDPSGRICLTGDTNSPEWKMTPNAVETTRDGFTDGFLVIVSFQ